MITQFELDWDGDRIADYPQEYRKALDKQLHDELEYEEWSRRKNEEYRNATHIYIKS